MSNGTALEASRVTPGGTLLRIKRILVPVDFSECSRKAVLYAVQLAKEFEAELEVIHVVPPIYSGDTYGFVDDSLEARMREAAEQKLGVFILQQVPQGLPARNHLRMGRPALTIAQTAKELDVDVIVISTHGHTGFKHAWLGSTAEQVVRSAPCPVLTVREKEHEFLA